MKKNILSLASAALALIALLSGCAQSPLESSLPQDDALPSGAIKWVVDPSIEMDGIRPVVTHEDVSYIDNEEHRLKSRDAFYGQVMIAEKDGLFGLIDYSGTIVLPISYELIEFGKYSEYDFGGEGYGQPFSEKVILAYAGAKEENGFRQYHLLDDSYQPSSELVYDSALESFLPQSDYYWDTAINHVTHWRVPNLAPPEAFEKISDATIPVPVRFVTRDYDEQRLDYLLPEKGYGFALNDTLIIDGGYGLSQHVREDIAAVFHDGKWQYITMDNTRINSVGYDAVNLAELEKSEGEEESWGGTRYNPLPFVYDFSEGLVAVCRDGLWGYMDKNGVEVIPCQYEATRPVHMGKAWIKENGLWGVADLSEYTG